MKTIYGYANARLRAMKSRLLDEVEYEGLLASQNVEQLISALLSTPYQPSVEAALVRYSGLRCITEALRSDMGTTTGKIRGFFRGRPADLVNLLLRPLDLHNIKTILRGQSRAVPADDVLAATLPGGTLGDAELRILAHQPNVGAVVDILATWALPFAQPLVAARSAGWPAAAQIARLELSLDQWHYHSALEEAGKDGANGRRLAEILAIEVDASNTLTVLRLARAPEERRMLREQYDAEDATPLLLPGGRLDQRTLARLSVEGDIGDVVSALAETPYGPALEEAARRYRETHRLGVFQQALEAYRVQRAAAMMVSDPLGIGVVIGYLALKKTEVVNLRLIAQGIALAMRPEEIREDMILPR